MAVVVSRRAPRSVKLSTALVRRLAEAMLVALELEDAELSILLTDDERIHALNLEHRAKDKPTDVLAFPMDWEGDEPGLAVGPRVLGDVVISLDTADRQARGRRRPLEEEVRFLLAHGLLHLVGHDHGTKDEKQLMDKETRRLVRAAPLP